MYETWIANAGVATNRGGHVVRDAQTNAVAKIGEVGYTVLTGDVSRA